MLISYLSYTGILNGQTDFGQLDTEHVDLAKMLVMEFALIYGNAWYEVPLPIKIGSLSQITALVVSDTFGLRRFIRPTESLNQPGQRPWSKFKILQGKTHSDFLFFQPTLGLVSDAAALDDVFFLRASMAMKPIPSLLPPRPSRVLAPPDWLSPTGWKSRYH